MLAQYQYDGAGRVNRLRQGNGVETRYGYGDDGTLSELTAVMPDGKVLLNLSYAYDGNGNCIRKGKDRYAYDSRNRLTEASYDGRWERYTYDHAGNRLSKETAAGCERYTYNALNQLTSLTKPDGAQTLYAYDSRGNLLEERGGRNRSYAYDALGRLIEADTENAVCRYHYDGEGMRYRSERDGVPSYSFYDRGSLLWEGSHPGSGIRYTRGVDTVCSEQGEGNRHHHVRDELGSALFLLDEAHNITKACRYDAFGNLLEESGQAPNRLLYTGQEYDRETGQYYLRARYYNPETGRFTQEDTYRGDGLNLYAYCANNPVKYVDPTGHMLCPINTTNPGFEGEDGTKILFRGDRASVVPDDVFENGFIPKGTHNDPLLHTVSNVTAGNFVSTSIDETIATGFAGKNGYVYVIQTDNYIDINSTYGPKAYFPEQMEFSIPGGVKPSEIIGAYKMQGGKNTGDFIFNPNFGGK